MEICGRSVMGFRVMFCVFELLFLVTLLNANSAVEDRCTSYNCKLPDCRCPGHNVPGGFKQDEVPQMILITFDDAVNWDNWDFYRELFPPDLSRLNPNGCPVSTTLFVSNNFTDYCMIRKLHARGIEIADHSVTHRLPHEWWSNAHVQELEDEIINQRNNLANLANIPLEDIRGWRSPFLQPTGDVMFDILYKNNFTYDATMTYPFPRNVYSPVMWPFTLDYSYTLVCNIDPCPKKSYPGLWIIPVVNVMDYREHLPCAYIDFCKNVPRNQDEAFQMLWKNFLRNYRTNRAPLYVNLHSVWLQTKHNFDAMNDFILRLNSMNDTYIVTVSQAIDWIKNPTPLSELKNFKPWSCVKEPNLEDKAFCSFTFKPIVTSKEPDTTTHKEHKSRSPDRKDTVVDKNTLDGTDKRLSNVKDHDEREHNHMHERRRKHRPWFLKNSASGDTNFVIFVLSFLLLFSVNVCMS